MKVFSFALMVAMIVTMATGFTACSTSPNASNPDVPNIVQQVEYSCAASATALKALKVASDHGKLTQAQSQQIIDAAATIAPICGSPDIPSLSSVELAAFTAAAAKLQTAAKSSPE